MKQSKKKVRILLKKLFPAIMISTSMSFMLAIYEPAVLYFNNKREFWYDFSLLCPIILLMFAIMFLLSMAVFGICCIWNNKLYQVALTVYTIIFLCTYVQGNYLVKKLPPLDGSYIDWSMYDYQRWYTIILWMVVIVAILFFIKLAGMDHFIKGVSYIGGGVTLMLLITAVVVCISTNGLERKLAMTLSTNYELEMSTNQNFVILILDSVDGKRMSEIMEKHPEYKETLSDFTTYQNVMGSYPYTQFAVPYIISGDWFECDELIDPYISNAYKDAELFQELEERGYRMGLYVGDAPMTDESMTRFENVVPDLGEFSSIIDFMKLELRLVGYKYAPYDLKRYSMMLPEEIPNLRKQRNDIDRVEFFNSNKRFYTDLQEKQITLSEENCFRLMHIEGAHVQTFTEGGTEVGEMVNTTYDQSIATAMDIVEMYLQKLKDSGVYDNTAIMILSDHGYNYHEIPCYTPERRQHPILFIKGIGEKHDEIQVSNAPIAQEDYQQAYIKLLDGANSSELFNYKEGDYRERRYLVYYNWDRDNMDEYVQTGSAENYETLIATGKTYSQHD